VLDLIHLELVEAFLALDEQSLIRMQSELNCHLLQRLPLKRIQILSRVLLKSPQGKLRA